MGYLRFFLTIAVLASHLIYHGWQGRTAVFGFFVLSGFLITLISNEIYNNGLTGKYYFLSNRFIRIYPTYWVCCAVAVFCLAATHGTLTSSTKGMRLPANWQEWWPNITIFGLDHVSGGAFTPYLLPTGWCLAIELVYYLIIGLISGRSKVLSAMLFVATSGVTARMVAHHDLAVFIYYSIYGPAPLFFLGSLLYHYRDRLKPLCIRQPLALLAIANITVYASLLNGFSRAHENWEIYVLFASSLPLLYVILCFYHLGQSKKPDKTEQFLADVSYPMFLLHMPAARTAFYLLTGEYRMGWDVFAIGTIATFIVASAIVVGIEQPLKRYRSSLRRRAVSSASAASLPECDWQKADHSPALQENPS